MKKKPKKLNGTKRKQLKLRIFLSAMSVRNAVSNIFLSNFHSKERKLIIFYNFYLFKRGNTCLDSHKNKMHTKGKQSENIQIIIQNKSKQNKKKTIVSKSYNILYLTQS